MLDARHEIRPFARDDDTKRVHTFLAVVLITYRPMVKIDTTSRHINDKTFVNNTLFRDHSNSESYSPSLRNSPKSSWKFRSDSFPEPPDAAFSRENVSKTSADLNTARRAAAPAPPNPPPPSDQPGGPRVSVSGDV